jgi:hypothetical protein
LDSYRHAVLTVTDRAAFAGKLGFDAVQLATEPGYVRYDGAVVAPWPALRDVAKRIAELDAPDLLARVAREDADARREAIHG